MVLTLDGESRFGHFLLPKALQIANSEKILNGGVESGSGTSADNWTQSGVDRESLLPGTTSHYAHSGSYYFDFGYSNSYSNYIEQTLGTSLAVADISSLTFWAATAYGSNSGTVRVIVTYTDASTSQQDFSISGLYVKLTFTNFTVGKTVSKIKFTSYSVNSFICVDDISLVANYSVNYAVGWILSKFYFYDQPNDKKPLKKTIDQSPIANQVYSYSSNKLTKTGGLAQLANTITAGNGYTLRAVALELDQYELAQDGSGSNYHNYFKITWDKLPDIVKTIDNDFDLIVNIYIKRL